MKRKQLRQLAKEINYGLEVNIAFTFNPAEHFCYHADTKTLEVSSFFYKLPQHKIIIYLTHEIGHMNTYQDAMFISTYAAEYEANKWALYRLDELGKNDELHEYKIYLNELANLNIEDEDDEEYQTAAVDLLLEMEIEDE